MNYKKLLFFTFLSAGFLLLLGNKQAFSQVTDTKKSYEDIYQHWFFAMDKFQSASGANKEDFGTFSRFSQKSLDSLRGDFMNKISNGKVTLANAKDYEDVLAKSINTLYKKFEKIEQLYPSSVEEYRHYHSPMSSQICESACDNINFATGDLSGWYAYYGFNSSASSFNITNITGGLAGAVKHAANDVLTSTSGYYIPLSSGCDGPNPNPDYQINITSGSRGDALVPSVPVVSPFGGSYSVMLGDSTEINYGAAILSQTFKVSSSNANFTYQYAVFLANPIHTYYHQPFFKVAVLDQDNDTIPFCGEYDVVSGNGTHNFDSLQYNDVFGCENFVVYYKNWSIVNVPLTKYIGQCVTIIFEVADCSQGGHFGYAYVDASCAPLSILSTSPNFCGQDSITLTGPAGEGRYKWTGPIGGIRGNDTLRIINVDSAGTYTLVVTPFTGATCNDTLKITIGKKPGPPPFPNFTADTGCVGMTMPFLNTSHPIGGSFYWDFYNNGTFEDSTVNATWKYNQPGVYQVKLQELYNGCGMDTVIKVVVDSITSSAFQADTVCFRDTTQFINASTGGVTYYWNFGDPPTGINNTSVITNPAHTFSAPGTYTVSLIAKHHDWCNDTVKETVVVLPLPKPSITGTDSICYGSSATITAGGGTFYTWNTGATTSSITVNPTNNPTTYTVRVSNGKCFDDTTYTVYIKPKLVGTINASSVCLNDTIHLTATGGGTYLWSNGATTSSIAVVAKSSSDSAFSVLISNGGKSCLALDTSITIYPLPNGSVCCNDTIYSGNSVVLVGGGGGSYYWIPPTGLSCDTCPNPIASPTSTTTYTLVTVSNEGCRANSEVTVDVEIPCKDFFVPNVFTPNGDGVNDTYLIKVEFMSAYEITIYNRWGRKVFYSTDPDAPWDGNINGSPAAAGVYYYLIRATCEDGNYFKKDGYLQLIRGK